MKTQEIIKALRRMAVNTKTMNCPDCGYEYNCSVYGCRVLREAADRLEGLQLENDSLLRIAMQDSIRESGLLDE